MFRSSKKRPGKGDGSKNRRTLVVHDEDDVELPSDAMNEAGLNQVRHEIPATQFKRKISSKNDSDERKQTESSNPVERKSKKAPFSTKLLSFDDQIEMEKGDVSLKFKSKDTDRRRKKGLGFGGGFHTKHENEDEQDEQVMIGSDVSKYSKDYINALLSEQRRIQKPNPSSFLESTIRLSDKETLKETNEYAMQPDEDRAPEFIPLYESETKQGLQQSTPIEDSQIPEPIILSGEDAISFHQQRNETGNTRNRFTQTLTSDPQGAATFYNTGSVDIEEGFEYRSTEPDDWEAELARRAGVSSVSLKSERNDYTYDDRFSRNWNSPTSTNSISTFRAAIEKSLNELEIQSNDLSTAGVRRKNEIDQSNLEYEQQKMELQNVGGALEFYQHWRSQMIGWVGAIREIREKVELILPSLHSLEADKIALNRWQDWENDMIAVLYEYKVLDRVVGRQPPDIIFHDVITTVDEFGRDVKSQHVLQREQRRRQRQRIVEKRTRQQYGISADIDLTYKDNIGAQSDGFVSDDEEETFRTRHDALMNALMIATQDLDDEYTRLHTLFGLFEEWYNEYPDEYNQCYASLSLADLASVHIQMELCYLNDPWNESDGYNEAKWMTIVGSALSSGYLDIAAVDRIFEKAVIPAIYDVFDKFGLNIASTKQMKAFSNFMNRVQKIFPQNEMTLNTIRRRMVSFVKEQLENLAIPIVIATTKFDHISKNDDENELQHAVFAATIIQMRRINKILKTLLQFWAPILQGERNFVETILQFISDKYLILLASVRAVHQQQKPLSTTDSPEISFREVMDALNTMGWLTQKENFLIIAPLRAAVKVFAAGKIDT